MAAMAFYLVRKLYARQLCFIFILLIEQRNLNMEKWQ